jgi:hypothetical protein
MDMLSFLDLEFPDKRQFPGGRTISLELFGLRVPVPTDPEVIRAVQQALRFNLTQWIESGFQPDGSEVPLRRNLKPNRGQRPPVVDSMARLLSGRSPVIDTRNGDAVYVLDEFDQGFPAFKIGKPKARPITAICGDGSFVFDFKPYAPFAPEDYAALAFMRFCQSDWKTLLMQCRQCRSFAVLNKPRKSYEHGWYCSKKCRNVNAKKTTEKNRKNHHDRWFGLAVDACARWDAMTRKPKQDTASWIYDEIKEHLPLVDRIHRQSIKRNLSEIEKQVRERNRAKS